MMVLTGFSLDPGDPEKIICTICAEVKGRTKSIVPRSRWYHLGSLEHKEALRIKNERKKNEELQRSLHTGLDVPIQQNSELKRGPELIYARPIQPSNTHIPSAVAMEQLDYLLGLEEMDLAGDFLTNPETSQTLRETLYQEMEDLDRQSDQEDWEDGFLPEDLTEGRVIDVENELNEKFRSRSKNEECFPYPSRAVRASLFYKTKD